MAIDYLIFLNDTYTKASKVIVLTLIHARHLSRLAAHQRSTCQFAAFPDTFNDLGSHINIEFSSRVVV